MALYCCTMKKVEYYTAYIEADSLEEAKDSFECGRYDDIEPDYTLSSDEEAEMVGEVYMDDDFDEDDEEEYEEEDD